MKGQYIFPGGLAWDPTRADGHAPTRLTRHVVDRGHGRGEGWQGLPLLHHRDEGERILGRIRRMLRVPGGRGQRGRCGGQRAAWPHGWECRPGRVLDHVVEAIALVHEPLIGQIADMLALLIGLGVAKVNFWAK